MTKSDINSKLLTGWLLLLLFAFPPTAQYVHICKHVCIHDVECGDDNDCTANHDCNSCAICRFAVFPFTQTQAIVVVCSVGVIHSKPDICREHIDSCITHNYMLRAPPALFGREVKRGFAPSNESMYL